MAIAVIWAILMIILDPVLFELTGNDMAFRLTNMGLFSLADQQPLLTSYPLIGVLLACVIVPLFAVFKFKDRKLQIKLMRFAMILQLGYLALVVFYMDRSQGIIGEETDLTPTLWVYSIIVPIACSFLAGRAIKKDDDMVRAADRLR